MHHIVIQFATDKTLAPKASLMRQWASKALDNRFTSAEVTIRIVDIHEMTTLNSTYRHKDGATNVLSFPFEVPACVTASPTMLGDIVICAEVVNREAPENARLAHWAHMIVHGVFHLFGYDHETDQEANEMEALEINIMQTLGFPNPYTDGEDIKHHD
jgi:probable rRNA maturation factor